MHRWVRKIVDAAAKGDVRVLRHHHHMHASSCSFLTEPRSRVEGLRDLLVLKLLALLMDIGLWGVELNMREGSLVRRAYYSSIMPFLRLTEPLILRRVLIKWLRQYLLIILSLMNLGRILRRSCQVIFCIVPHMAYINLGLQLRVVVLLPVVTQSTRIVFFNVDLTLFHLMRATWRLILSVNLQSRVSLSICSMFFTTKCSFIIIGFGALILSLAFPSRGMLIAIVCGLPSSSQAISSVGSLAARTIERVVAAVTWALVFPFVATTLHWGCLCVRVDLLWSNQERVWLVVDNSDFSCRHDEFINELIDWIATVVAEVERPPKVLGYPTTNLVRLDAHREFLKHLVKES